MAAYRRFAVIEDGILIRSRSQLDMLLVNIEAAVKIEQRSDFFSWVQGVFQALIPHEVLICALIEPATRSYRMEWMSSAPIDDARFLELCDNGGGVIGRIIGLWERTGRRPVRLDPEMASEGIESMLVGDAERLGLDGVLAHGVPDIEGRAAGFFTFSKIPGGVERSHVLTLELIAPYLNAAWARARCEGARRAPVDMLLTRQLLTARELEILNWVEQGKSNGEIGRILDISHLTVKNHVQKILRKLNVHNRTHAVAKGISLNLTRPRMH